jgi:hypothetical protein
LGKRAREVQHDEVKAVVHVAAVVGAWSGEGTGGSELGRPSMAAPRSACARALAERRNERGGELRRVREAGHPLWGERRRWDARWHGAGRWGAAALHGGHAPITSSTWRASAWPEREAILGRFRSEFGHGQKMKFVHLGLLYKLA